MPAPLHLEKVQALPDIDYVMASADRLAQRTDRPQHSQWELLSVSSVSMPNMYLPDQEHTQFDLSPWINLSSWLTTTIVLVTRYQLAKKSGILLVQYLFNIES